MSYENQLIREATGQGREFEMSLDETPPAQEDIEPNETSDQQGEIGALPIEYLREYDGAAEHFARKGELPQAMGSPGALDYILGDPEAFEQRVRDFKYAHAMERHQ